MKRGQTRVLGLAVAAALFGAALMPGRAAAQSELDVGQAQEFMGSWLVSLDAGGEEFLVELVLEDEGGKVAASVTTLPLGTQQVTDITRAEDTLTMQWEADAQGQIFPVLVTLTPSGEDLAVFLDLGGQLALEGIGTRTAS
jgi:hypothetical protein